MPTFRGDRLSISRRAPYRILLPRPTDATEMTTLVKLILPLPFRLCGRLCRYAHITTASSALSTTMAVTIHTAYDDTKHAFIGTISYAAALSVSLLKNSRASRKNISHYAEISCMHLNNRLCRSGVDALMTREREYSRHFCQTA